MPTPADSAGANPGASSHPIGSWCTSRRPAHRADAPNAGTGGCCSRHRRRSADVFGAAAGMDEDRVAAMSAALLSLGERAAEGLGRGGLSQVHIQGESGGVWLLAAGDDAVLVGVSAAGRQSRPGALRAAPGHRCGRHRAGGGRAGRVRRAGRAGCHAAPPRCRQAPRRTRGPGRPSLPPRAPGRHRRASPAHARRLRLTARLPPPWPASGSAGWS